MTYNTSHKKMNILSSKMNSLIRYIDTMGSEGDLVAFGGMPSGSNGKIFPIEIMKMNMDRIVENIKT